MDKKNIYEALSCVQTELKAPKNQKNTFGGYNYRSCEDILEAVKPLLKAHGLVLHLHDEPVVIGDWHYIKATAELFDFTDQRISCSAFAREPEQKTKMDAAQVTGTSSSYARKYALNGLFCIDDTKDPDTDEYQKQTAGRSGRPTQRQNPPPVQKQQEAPPLCACCGKPIQAVKTRSGQFTVQDVAAKTSAKYGRVLCWECAKKQPKEDGGMTHA